MGEIQQLEDNRTLREGGEVLHGIFTQFTNRYIAGSSQPDRAYPVEYRPGPEELWHPLSDYTRMHYPSHPLRGQSERIGRLASSKIAGIRGAILDEVIIPAYAGHAEELVDRLQQEAVVHVTDHSPDFLGVVAHLGETLAVAEHFDYASSAKQLHDLIKHVTYGVGSRAYAPMMVRLLHAQLPAVPMDHIARFFTNTVYTIPANEKIRQAGIPRELGRAYRREFLRTVVGIAQQRTRHPLELFTDWVVVPAATRPEEMSGVIVLPPVNPGVSEMIIAMGAAFVENYSSFHKTNDGQTAAHFEINRIISAADFAKHGHKIMKEYMRGQAAFRTEKEGRLVVAAV